MNPRLTEQQRSRESLFFLVVAASMMLVVFIGFARSFFLSFLWREPAPNTSSEAILYVHGFVFTAWMVLFIAQPALIKASHVNKHRQLGWAGAALAIVVVILGVRVCFVAAARSATSAMPPLPLDSFGVIVSGVLMFGVLVALAIAFRRDGQTHKRLMLLASVNMLEAAVARILVPLTGVGEVTTFLVAFGFILPLVVWDLVTLKRVHPATLWGGLGIVASLPLRFWVSGTPAWLAAARNIVGVVD